MTLAIIPAFIRDPEDLDVTLKAIASVRHTARDVELVVIDDCSPAEHLVLELEDETVGLDFELWRNPENMGFSRTVNRGLVRARSEGRDAVLINADIECVTPGWDRLMASSDAAITGPMLLYPGGELIQHAGIFFSFLTRIFDHRFRFAPVTLPEANVPFVCPVTGAFQYIRHDTLQRIGIYDEGYRMAWEDVEYCLRAFGAGLECRYDPQVKAIHHESMFRGRADRKLTDWQKESLARLMEQIRDVNLARFVPEMV